MSSAAEASPVRQSAPPARKRRGRNGRRGDVGGGGAPSSPSSSAELATRARHPGGGGEAEDAIKEMDAKTKKWVLELTPVLDIYGYDSMEIAQLVIRCQHDPERIQAAVDAIFTEKAGHEEMQWTTKQVKEKSSNVTNQASNQGGRRQQVQQFKRGGTTSGGTQSNGPPPNRGNSSRPGAGAKPVPSPGATAVPSAREVSSGEPPAAAPPRVEPTRTAGGSASPRKDKKTWASLVVSDTQQQQQQQSAPTPAAAASASPEGESASAEPELAAAPVAAQTESISQRQSTPQPQQTTEPTISALPAGDVLVPSAFSSSSAWPTNDVSLPGGTPVLPNVSFGSLRPQSGSFKFGSNVKSKPIVVQPPQILRPTPAYPAAEVVENRFRSDNNLQHHHGYQQHAQRGGDYPQQQHVATLGGYSVHPTQTATALPSNKNAHQPTVGGGAFYNYDANNMAGVTSMGVNSMMASGGANSMTGYGTGGNLTPLMASAAAAAAAGGSDVTAFPAYATGYSLVGSHHCADTSDFRATTAAAGSAPTAARYSGFVAAGPSAAAYTAAAAQQQQQQYNQLYQTALQQQQLHQQQHAPAATTADYHQLKQQQQQVNDALWRNATMYRRYAAGAASSDNNPASAYTTMFYDHPQQHQHMTAAHRYNSGGFDQPQQQQYDFSGRKPADTTAADFSAAAGRMQQHPQHQYDNFGEHRSRRTGF